MLTKRKFSYTFYTPGWMLTKYKVKKNFQKKFSYTPGRMLTKKNKKDSYTLG